ncbi:hypothetical protein TNCV_4228631 [Trichonephila clavipes]|nr:hypothetical protein TNCV_4228631 [Trichonephila clavipes]
MNSNPCTTEIRRVEEMMYAKSVEDKRHFVGWRGSSEKRCQLRHPPRLMMVQNYKVRRLWSPCCFIVHG